MACYSTVRLFRYPCCANTLTAGLPPAVPGSTVNRLCGWGWDAIGIAARAIRSGETSLMIAAGVESMSRAPPKADSAFSRVSSIQDTTIGWRLINPAMKALHSVDSMPETAENAAAGCVISREDQDFLAFRSQAKAATAQKNGFFAAEIVSVAVPQRRGDLLQIAVDEHPRASTMEALAKLKPVVKLCGTVTAGNASGVNDGACALLLASEAEATRYQLTPVAIGEESNAADCPMRCALIYAEHP